MVTALGWAATAVGHNADDQTASHDVVMTSALGPSSDTLVLSITQVFFPGMSERTGCRMQITARNQSSSRISMRALVNTFDSAKEAVDTWLVPTGDLKPGEEVLRIYSCRTAHDATVSEASPYAWPQTCVIDGAATSPCPVTLHVSSSIAAPPGAKEKGEGH